MATISDTPLAGNASARTLSVSDAGDGVAPVDSAHLLLQGDYARSGPDLVITGSDGTQVVVRGFFTTDPPPALHGPNGEVIAGDLAARLAGPIAPGQAAQAGTSASDAGGDVIGTVTSAKGTITATRADGTQVELQVGDPVYANDIIETSDGGGVGITFVDETEFALGAGGRLVLDELVYDPATGDGSAQFSLMSGAFSFVSGQLAKAGPDAVAVRTPLATIGIRGTSGSINIGEGDLQVVLIPDADGAVGEIQVTTANGTTFSINNPMGAMRMAGGQVQTFVMSQQEFSQTFGASLNNLSNAAALNTQVQQTAPATPDDAPPAQTMQDGGPDQGQQDGPMDGPPPPP
ncbi:MAG: FecR domain-containing protein, partial [Rhodospirillaceae bacterium]